MEWRLVAIAAGLTVLAVACTSTRSAPTSAVVDATNTASSRAPVTTSTIVEPQDSPAMDGAVEATTGISQLVETTATLPETPVSTTTASEPQENLDGLIDDLDDLLGELDDLLDGLADEGEELDGAMSQDEGDIEE
jgi:hypothetical protein